jgi:hypothetical protein
MPEPVLLFEMPGGRLELSGRELERWAEHLCWCYRMLGVPERATIAIADFGTSPLAFLSSTLLTPGLAAGVAERLDARVVCLDASHDRVLLAPMVLSQLRPDVLVVRADVFGLLAQAMQSKRIRLSGVGAPCAAVIVTGKPERFAELGDGPFRKLVLVEASLVMAPQCLHCGAFHLREGFYRLEGGAVCNLHLPDAAPWPLPHGWRARQGGCAERPGDWLIEAVAAGGG